MKTLRDCLIAVRDRAGSERKAATLFGVSNTAFNAWMVGPSVPSDDNAVKLAALLGLDDAYVLALVAAARAKDADMRARWQRVAERFKDAAVVAALAIGAASFGYTPPAHAGQFDISKAKYTLRNKRRWLHALN